MLSTAQTGMGMMGQLSASWRCLRGDPVFGRPASQGSARQFL